MPGVPGPGYHCRSREFCLAMPRPPGQLPDVGATGNHVPVLASTPNIAVAPAALKAALAYAHLPAHVPPPILAAQQIIWL